MSTEDFKEANPFLEDATYCLRRASRALCSEKCRDTFYDASIYYAFGMEKLLKAIIHDVNPVFLLESAGFENAVCAVYEKRLVEKAKKKVDKDVNRSLIPFQASMIRAAKFSQAVEDNFGRLTKLADIRGTLAHRFWSELDVRRDYDFLLMTFSPLIERFAEEMEFEPDDCFDPNSAREQLKKLSEDLLAQEDYGNYIRETLAKHQAIWDRRKVDPVALQTAIDSTRRQLAEFKSGGPYSQSGVCPCCVQPAVLFYRFIDLYGQDEVATVGAYAVGLVCYYCDIELSGYRAIDHFKLNDQVNLFSRRSSTHQA